MRNSPINRAGGKSQLTIQILKEFPKEAKMIIEPFCGSCVITINWLEYMESINVKSTALINDIDKDLIDFWKKSKNR